MSTPSSTPLPSAQEIAQILDALDGHPHATRQRHIAVLCHTLAMHQHTTQLDELLDTLYKGDFTRQALAITGASAAHHVSALCRGVQAPSLHIQRLAFAALCAQPDALPHLLDLIALDDQHVHAQLVVKVRTLNQRAFARPLIQALRARGEEDMARSLLPLCDDFHGIEDLLDPMEQEIPWKSLAQRSPELVLDLLEEHLTERPTHSLAHFYCGMYMPALAILVARAPHRVAKLVAMILPESSFCYSALPTLRHLSHHAPHETHRILVETESFVHYTPHLPHMLGRAFRAWPEALQRDTLGRLTQHPLLVAKLLAMVAPSKRAALFESCWTQDARATIIWDDAFMQVLPHATRQQEAARILLLPAVREHIFLTWRYTAYLHLDVSHDLLLAATRRADADERAASWAALVRAYHVARVPLTPLLELTARHKNERDPVRLTTLQAISDISGAHFCDEDAPLLLHYARFVVEARDTSWGTRAQLLTIFKNLMTAHAHTGSMVLVRCAFEGILMLATQGQLLDLPYLEHHLSQDAATQLATALLPWLKEAESRAYHSNILSLVQRLGKRAWPIVALQELLPAIIKGNKTHRMQAASLWLADPSTRVARALTLLEYDASAFLVPEVAQVLHRSRQDLLDPFLTGAPLKGAFASTPNVYVLPGFNEGFFRWNTSQQRTFIRTMLACIHDSAQTIWTRAALIGRLARITLCTLDDLLPLIHDDEIPISEAALGATIWLDQPQEALPVLIEFTHDDRARVAMYAIPRLAKLVTPDVLLRALDAVLERPHIKITVHKEVMRLLGGLRSEQAAQRVAAAWQTPNVHRDVRIAILHAARALFTFPATRHILEHAHADADAEVLQAWLGMSLFELPLSERVPYFTWQLPLATHEDSKVRTLFFSTLANALWLLNDHEDLLRALADALTEEILALDHMQSWQQALRTMLRGVDTPIMSEACLHTLRTLIARRDARHEDATRDLPARQRLERFILHINQAWHPIPEEFERALIHQVTWPEECWPLRASLALTSALKRSCHASSQQLERILRDAPDVVELHVLIRETCAQNHRVSEEDALAMYAHLAQSDDEMVQRAAFDYLTHAGAAHAWAGPWRRALEQSRQSTLPSIRRRAHRLHAIAE